MKLRQKYKAIGVMSGTSVDGLDMVCCEFVNQRNTWNFTFICGETKQYTPSWQTKLATAHRLSGEELVALDYAFGRFVGQSCGKFIKNNSISSVDIIASHGHTVFHRPGRGITCQIGNGHAIHALTNIPVIYDFRSLDVCHGGQGAPLVSIGDSLLFHEYPVCLNLGGIANLSARYVGNKRSFDICFANMGLNYLAQKVNKKYDNRGKMAMGGKVIVPMLNTLNSTYKTRKKALARERFERDIRPVLDDTDLSVEDKLCTFCEHIALNIGKHIPVSDKTVKILVTGGGACNNFLIQRIVMHVGCRGEVIVPPEPIVMFKEAIIFSLLGLLRIRGETNILRSITGGRQNTSSGAIVGNPIP